VVPGAELGRVLSPPMVRLVELMLGASDNVLAEALARQVAVARGESASFEGAARAMGDTLADLGMPLVDGALADGSGLSRGNLLTADLLAGLLRAALTEPRLAGTLSGLPVAGWSATLADRYRTPAPGAGPEAPSVAGPGAGVVRAKTGTLFGVFGLAGLVVTVDGRLLVFALLANDAPADTWDLLDRSAASLAGCGCR
jgi:serine-type D-Ala-D-Ala carboxypeptidase/endopeptidase (penicillin-binding protein 4)